MNRAEAIGAVLDKHVGWQMHRGQMIDDILAALAAHDAEVLRAAADEVPWDQYEAARRDVSGWLLERADRIEAGEQL